MTISAVGFFLAQAQPAGGGAAAAPPAPAGVGAWVLLLAAMALAPFVLTMVTSFAKLVIVGSILRHAIGTPQIPPTTVITGLALILTVHVMAPVVSEIYNAYEKSSQTAPANEGQLDTIRRVATAAEGPMREFLTKHSHPQNTAMFDDLGSQMATRQGGTAAATPAVGAGAADAVGIQDPLVRRLLHDLTVTLPAFVLSQLTEAFQIGFLLFVPFLVIDLVVSNVLMAMGMQMMSPTTISMPLKLLLFVLVDGWRMIMRGLVLSYA